MCERIQGKKKNEQPQPISRQTDKKKKLSEKVKCKNTGRHIPHGIGEKGGARQVLFRPIGEKGGCPAGAVSADPKMPPIQK